MMKIAILGGTGDLGGGLAWQLAKAGHAVIIGSRRGEAGAEAARSLAERLAAEGIPGEPSGSDNASAAAACDIAILVVPFAHQMATVEPLKVQLAGKILVDATVPLVPPKVARVQLPEEGSAAQRSQAALGEDVRVVSAFQNVPAHALHHDDDIDLDVLVSGDKRADREVVADLIASIGLRPVHAGPLANSAAAEALTSVLIFINKQFKCHSGLRITGIPGAPAP